MRQVLLLAASVACLAFASAGAEGQAPEAPPFGPNEGQVMELDRVAGEMTIRHGYIPELSMDPMTMVFVVANTQQFDKVRNGDRVRFQAGLVDGRFGIITIKPVKAPEK